MRQRSLEKDGNDANAFRHHRERFSGHSFKDEYYQQLPFFFTRECAQLNLVGQYKGASAFLVLNGPSLVSGDYDLSKLNEPGVVTYGVNNGPATFRPTFWSCVDDPQRFLKSIWLDPAITKFVPHAHAEKPIFDNETWAEMKDEGKKIVVGDCPNCIYFHRNEKFVANRWLYEDKINWGNSKHNGGGRTVMLAVMRILFLLGFRKVYLLGADFTMTSEYAYHFDEKREAGSVKGNTKTYNIMNNTYFPELKPYFEKEGFNVYNCNPDSGLKCFDYKPFDEAIEEATGKLGEVKNQRTWGMYCKTSDKHKAKVEPNNNAKKHLNSLVNRDDVLSNVEKPVKQVKKSQEPAIRTTKIDKPNPVNKPVQTKPRKHRVLAIKNDIETTSNGNILRNRVDKQLEECGTPKEEPNSPKVTKEDVKTVNVTPRVERVEEIPQTPPPPTSKIKGERKLIKHLPFRS